MPVQLLTLDCFCSWRNNRCWLPRHNDCQHGGCLKASAVQLLGFIEFTSGTSPRTAHDSIFAMLTGFAAVFFFVNGISNELQRLQAVYCTRLSQYNKLYSRKLNFGWFQQLVARTSSDFTGKNRWMQFAELSVNPYNHLRTWVCIQLNFYVMLL
jgi:hypothetical protein